MYSNNIYTKKTINVTILSKIHPTHHFVRNQFSVLASQQSKLATFELIVKIRKCYNAMHFSLFRSTHILSSKQIPLIMFNIIKESPSIFMKAVSSIKHAPTTATAASALLLAS